ncbi:MULTISPECIES: flagellar biosynthesis protein FlhB [unclassified Methylobacterium]|uniref:flagellar biosynthesis protein FlhB n=1 Tax=unclassified Methylobacterium TaxID=2615210 RepID=UPI0007015E5F|nr:MULTISPECIES: flagellar biosynthesis protein FlhB [unclassified Methylobacterium]KQP85510.1 flagellar biosynthetic protein FlhB [Methylobacterium sp. Leaf113]KQP96675.1 flagellar biosynthetic protein FlhB [Methylobacterium sp. Leaf117]MCK2055753.1 flagellar biosynthesis protein FlhB [Methylobacterium sp. 37f]
MADDSDPEDKTEDPTPRRIEKAIEQGNVPNSPEINTFFILAAFTMALLMVSGMIAKDMVASMRGFLMNAHMVPSDPTAYTEMGLRTLIICAQALCIPVGLVVVAGLAAGMIQHPFVFSTEALGPKWDRVSPMAGVKRVFGMEALFQFVKGLAKLGMVGVVAGTILWGERDRMEVFARLDPSAVLAGILTLALKMMAGMLAVFVAIALGDAVYQRFRWRQRLRMSKEEMKQEHKESEGSPEVKGRLKQLRAQRVKKRMMAAVPTATVIVTNPTHYAVALRYEAGMAAPVCVAKGVDSLALKIRAVAKDHDVPILENPPLARALHATVEIDEEIPAEHYRAVAEVIGYVMRLRRRAA